MLDYVLSKMNLLILVAAIFSIVAFFMFNLSYITTVEESRLVVQRITDQAYNLMNSPSYCDSSYYYIPKVISVPGSNFFYAMKVSTITTEKETSGDETEEVNYVIFSIFPRKELKKAVASDSLLTSAKVRLFGFDEQGDVIEVSEEGTVLDPQARKPIDAFIMIKEIEKGVPNFYFIPCSTSKYVCDSIKEQIAGKFLGERKEFYC